MINLIRRIRALVANVFFSVLRMFFYVFRIKKNRILFMSFYGRQYSCNPRAIYEGLSQLKLDFEYVWVVRSNDLPIPGKFKSCRYRSLKYYYYLFTSRFVIINTGLANDMVFRKRQIVIETWHGGGCYKKVGIGKNYSNDFDRWLLKKRSGRLSYFISSSRYFTKKTIRDFYAYDGDVLEIGMPRNDLLFDKEECKKRNLTVRKKLGLDNDEKVVLYAPTYRDLGHEYDELDWDLLKPAFQKMFNGKKVILAYRGHHKEKKKAVKGVLDLSSYHDMQDLLAMADVLITDYSSSIWDFSLTLKPCFLFIPDYEDYNRERGFDVLPKKWGFPYAMSNKELLDKIDSFDKEDFIKEMKKHQEKLGSFENGTATKRVIDLILEKMNEA